MLSMLVAVFDSFMALPTLAKWGIGILLLLIIFSILKKFIKFAILLAVLTILVLIIIKLLGGLSGF